MNRPLLLLILTLCLAACKDEKEVYPECDSTWWCDFSVSSWNEGSTNYWIYGENKDHYYYYDGSLIGTKYVSIPREKADACRGFDSQDVLTWESCDPSLVFNCEFVVGAKIVYTTYSSATARKDDKYPHPPDRPRDFDCSQ